MTLTHHHMRNGICIDGCADSERSSAFGTVDDRSVLTLLAQSTPTAALTTPRTSPLLQTAVSADERMHRPRAREVPGGPPTNGHLP